MIQQCNQSVVSVFAAKLCSSGRCRSTCTHVNLEAFAGFVSGALNMVPRQEPSPKQEVTDACEKPEKHPPPAFLVLETTIASSVANDKTPLLRNCLDCIATDK